MRYHDIVPPVFEMAQPSDAMRQQTFYHGTPSDEKGRSILINGLRPGNNTTQSRSHLKPVAGRTYLTSKLRYGIIYCIGGDMLGCSEDSIEYLTGKAGQYGWLFVISGASLANDVQPDEDSVGEAVMYIDQILKNKDMRFYDSNPFCQALMQADPQRLKYFHWNAKQAMTPKQWDGAIFGYIAAQASGGKRFLKVMTDADKHWLISCGAHVAYQGPIVPDQAWRFDKQKTPQLAKDGSNFFALAEQVK